MEETNKQTEDNSTENTFYDWLGRVYERFNVLSEFKEGDGFIMTAAKIVVRIFGFFLLLLLSPFIMIGLMLAFFAAL